MQQGGFGEQLSWSGGSYKNFFLGKYLSTVQRLLETFSLKNEFCFLIFQNSSLIASSSSFNFTSMSIFRCLYFSVSHWRTGKDRSSFSRSLSARILVWRRKKLLLTHIFSNFRALFGAPPLEHACGLWGNLGRACFSHFLVEPQPILLFVLQD